MNIIQTFFDSVCVIKPNAYPDDRGIFFESFNKSKYSFINEKFVQDNISFSKKNVIRGLHYQKSNPQGKLVSCLDGEVLDVFVDIREDSPTYGHYDSIILSSANKLQVWIPPGFAHGFSVLSDTAYFMYKCTDYYNPNDEYGIAWNDKMLDIDWMVSNPVISDKDRALEGFY